MTRQSLETEIENIVIKFVPSTSVTSQTQPTNRELAITALLSQVDKYVEERERLAWIDALKVVYALMTDNTNEDAIGDTEAYISLRLKSLRQQVKGGQ